MSILFNCLMSASSLEYEFQAITDQANFMENFDIPGTESESTNLPGLPCPMKGTAACPLSSCTEVSEARDQQEIISK